MKRIKLKTIILTSLLFIPMLFIGSGLNNTKINGKTLRDNPINNKYGTITNVAVGETGTYGFSSHMSDGLDHLWIWGANENGQLGLGNNSTDPKYEYQPIDITGGLDPVTNKSINRKLKKTEKITQFSIGAISAGAVVETTNDNGTTFDQLYMWGNNSDGQLGDGGTARQNSPENITDKLKTHLGNSMPINSKVLNFSLKGDKSSAELEYRISNKTKDNQIFYHWGKIENNSKLNPTEYKFLPEINTITDMPVKATPPLVPPVYIVTNGKDKLAYIITGSIVGAILLVAIIVISIMYHLYRKEKTKKQLI